MKRKTKFFMLLVTATSFNASAQTPPVTADLRFHLDAGSGYNTNPGPADDVWHDKTGFNNDVTTPGTSTDPVFIANSNSTGFPGIHFDRSTSSNMTSIFPATGWAAADNVTSATIFVVRIGQRFLPGSTQALITICDDNNFNEEFTLCWDESAKHHTSRNNWIRKQHQCSDPFLIPPATGFPGNEPVLETAIFRTGVTNADLDYFINGTFSTQTITTLGMPMAYTGVDRMIGIGARFNGSPTPFEFLEGDILEVLAYARALTLPEVNQVNDWLKQKYFIDGNEYCSTPVTLTQNCNDRAGLVLKYLGHDGNGDCMYEADFIQTTQAGYTNLMVTDFDWNVSNVWTRSPAPFSFTVPPTGSSTPVEVKGYFNSDMTVAGLPYCCDIYLQRTVTCDAVTGETN